MAVFLYENDLPEHFNATEAIAIDTETMGLVTARDRLCLVQLSTGDGNAHLVRIAQNQKEAPILEGILGNPDVLKIFHFARFDIAALVYRFGVIPAPVYCTKIASKLARTYTDKHGLAALVSEILGVELSKQQQSSDWGANQLTPEQQNYAASDVLYLHQLRERLNVMLEREERIALAQISMDFLPARALLDLEGFGDVDIFSHA